MIVEFSVENFRSIKDKVTLSAVASRGRAVKIDGEMRRPDDEITVPVPVLGRDFELLPVLAIYGANASGKSNVLLALNYLLRLTRMETGEHDREFQRLEPFAFDENTTGRPTRFELQVALEAGIYTYVLALDQSRIYEESLSIAPAVPNRNVLHKLFNRRWDSATGEVAWEMNKRFYKADRQLYLQIKRNIGLGSTYLGKLIDLGLFPVSDFQGWLVRAAPNVVQGWGRNDFEHFYAAFTSAQKPDVLSRNATLISLFDTGIQSISVERDESAVTPSVKIASKHKTARGDFELPFEAESTGTQRLLGVGHFLIQKLRDGGLILIDELSSNIHPYIAREIVRFFQSSKINRHHAQLIFTSHDLTLWQNDLLRRDQFWLTEKDEEGATRLYPLSDYKIRNDLSLGKAYLDARFGAVPLLADEDEFARLINEN